MRKILEKVQMWWYFHIANPVVRMGEKGGFKWVFRRFWLEITTLSGNFKARFMASEHPYGYLLAGKEDNNIEGYCQMLYTVAMLLTTDQGFVDDVRRAVEKYEKRLGKVKNEEDEEMAMADMKDLQEHLELPKKERRKVERDINGRFKKAIKSVENEKNSSE